MREKERGEGEKERTELLYTVIVSRHNHRRKHLITSLGAMYTAGAQ